MRHGFVRSGVPITRTGHLRCEVGGAVGTREDCQYCHYSNVPMSRMHEAVVLRNCSSARVSGGVSFIQDVVIPLEV